MAALILLGLMSPLPALADCTSPVGVEADMYYNTTFKRVQYCDGTNWVNMGVGNSGPTDNLGNHTATQALAMANFKITGLATPTVATDAVTKAYVDGLVGGGDNLGDHIATTVLRSDTHNTDDLGTTAIRWKGGWFAGAVTAGSFAGVGTNLTALNATNLTSGTVPDARFPATLPALSGVNLTALNATNLGSGTVATARLGTGTANATTYLRGDGQWVAVSGGGDDLGNHIATTVLRSDTHNTDDLGTTAIRWKDGWFAGAVTAVSFAGDGSGLTNVPGAAAHGMVRYTANATFTVPAGVTQVKATMIGGGGGGGRAFSSTIGCGGGGGAFIVKWTSVTPGAAMPVVIGQGGAGGATNGTNGSAGTDTTFDGLTAQNGAGGSNTTSCAANGGAASGGNINISGTAGAIGAGGIAAQWNGRFTYGDGGDGTGSGTVGQAGKDGMVIIEW